MLAAPSSCYVKILPSKLQFEYHNYVDFHTYCAKVMKCNTSPMANSCSLKAKGICSLCSKKFIDGFQRLNCGKCHKYGFMEYDKVYGLIHSSHTELSFNKALKLLTVADDFVAWLLCRYRYLCLYESMNKLFVNCWC